MRAIPPAPASTTRISSMSARCSLWRPALCLAASLAVPLAKAGDSGKFTWPGWRGPHHDGVSRETGLLKDWPQNGPRVVWQIENVGVAYSSLAVADGRIYTQG